MGEINWEIRQYSGLDCVAVHEIPWGLTKSEILQIMKMLYARHLTPNELVRGSLRRKMKDRTPLLDYLESDGCISLGENPHFIAILKKTLH